MTTWGIAGALYGLVLAVAALTHPIRRRHIALASALAFALASLAAGTLITSFWTNLLVPGGLLLSGYWLSGFYFRDPQAWLEAWLLDVDRIVSAQTWRQWLPRPVMETLELIYASVYLVVAGGAIYAATYGITALAYYWGIVLASAFASYGPLPWLRSRPPRALEPASHPIALRGLNLTILDRASIQANTLPSGHVSGAVAAALGVFAVDQAVGSLLLGIAGLIAVAAVAGRYHYVADCVTGAAVAAGFFLLLRPAA